VVTTDLMAKMSGWKPSHITKGLTSIIGT
jgi:hypothetical protein